MTTPHTSPSAAFPVVEQWAAVRLERQLEVALVGLLVLLPVQRPAMLRVSCFVRMTTNAMSS